jgi:hypothetical protein
MAPTVTAAGSTDPLVGAPCRVVLEVVDVVEVLQVETMFVKESLKVVVPLEE